MKFTHQDPTNLILGIAPQALALDLTVLRESILTLGAWSFTFQVIGESHTVQIRRDTCVIWQEILACVPLCPDDCTHYHQFTRLAAHQFSAEVYQVKIEFRRNKPESLHRLSNPGLEVQFPALKGQKPVTQMRWQQQPDRVRWWTLHLYPTDGETVMVQSASEFLLK